ncbi:MAG: hypothetical protein KDI61_11660 [Alphaproteobacteria bacterium]|nr:hypothetical protein [Alphaproteobacteria bacterium]
MIEGLGNSLRAFWSKYVNRVKPVSKVDNEGMNTDHSRERERFSARKGAEAQTHFTTYGPHGEEKPLEPPGHDLDEIG